MATLNIQTATKGVYSINLQTTPPAVGPYVTVQGENTDVYYAPAIKTTCGPIAVQVNDCGPTSGCWPVRRLTNAVLEHYLICSITLINCSSPMSCCEIVAPRDWFEFGPIDVTMFPPSHSDFCFTLNTNPRHTFGIRYTWAIANNAWYTAFANTCDGADITGGGGGPWPAGLGYASPDALCCFYGGQPCGYNEYSYGFWAGKQSTSVGDKESMLTQLRLTNAAGGANNDIQYTYAASMGQGQIGNTMYSPYLCVYGGWTAASYSPGWAIANTACTLPYDSGHRSYATCVTGATPMATVLCNILPTSSTGTICLTFSDFNSEGREGETLPVWGLGNNGCANASCLIRGHYCLSTACTPFTANILCASGCVFGGCGYDLTINITSQGYTGFGWLNNMQDANAPIYTPDPRHCGQTYIHICGWRYVEPTP